MASARFQFVVVTNQIGGAESAVRTNEWGQLGVIWRLLSPNNRDLGRAANVFPDIQSCLFAVRLLRQRLGDATEHTVRAGRASWAWKLRMDGTDVAVSSREYARRVRCEQAYAVFVESVPQARLSEASRVVHG